MLCSALLAALPLHPLQRETPLAHVDASIPFGSATVPSVLRWWCGDENHAAGPLCVRHEIALQIAKAQGAERRISHAQRQSLLGEAAMRELKHALAAFCERGNSTAGQRNASVLTICTGAAAAASRYPRESQLIDMNTWWCDQPGHNMSLSCRRHVLQLAHSVRRRCLQPTHTHTHKHARTAHAHTSLSVPLQTASTASEREAVHQRLEELLEDATPEARG